MTTSPRIPGSIHHRESRADARRRRLLAPLLAAAIGLGGASALFGLSSSPGRTPVGPRQAEVAIPGVRGTGGGGGYYGVSTSPGRFELALPRKAGGTSPEFL